MIVMTAEQAVDLDTDIQSHEKDSAPTTVFFSKLFGSGAWFLYL